MPELPEVETVKETLKKKLIGKTIKKVEIYHNNIIEYPTVEKFKLSIINQKINNMDRYGKWLIFELDKYYLLSHLRMEGKYFFRTNLDIRNKHEHIVFTLDDIELRIFAELSGVEELINAFKNKEDIHSKTASDIYGVSIDNVTKDMRRNAKAVNFGIVYGISSFGLSDNLGISKKEAQEFIDKYFSVYPGIKEYQDNTIKLAYETKCVRTLLNRKRKIEELNNVNSHINVLEILFNKYSAEDLFKGIKFFEYSL